MNVFALKKQLRKGGWHRAARNLEYESFPCTRRDIDVDVTIHLTTSGSLAAQAYMNSASPVLLATEAECLVFRPSDKPGPRPGSGCQRVVKLSPSETRRQRWLRAAGDEPLATWIAKLVDAHVDAMGVR